MTEATYLRAQNVQQCTSNLNSIGDANMFILNTTLSENMYIDSGEIQVNYGPSGDITDNMLTKGLDRENFCNLRDRAELTKCD